MPPGSKFFHFHAVFSKRKVGTPALGVGAPPGKSWIRHCYDGSSIICLDMVIKNAPTVCLLHLGNSSQNNEFQSPKFSMRSFNFGGRR